jgi:hypothetical protein
MTIPELPMSDPESAQATVQTRVSSEELELLVALLRCETNRRPQFRIPDLLGACVSLTLSDAHGPGRLLQFLRGELVHRDAPPALRSCDIWPAQFRQLDAARQASWNRFPHPRFAFEDLATACIAVAMKSPFGPAAVLQEARANWLGRTLIAPAPVF